MNNEHDDENKVVQLHKPQFKFQILDKLSSDDVGLTDHGVSVLLYPERLEGVMLSPNLATEIGVALISAAAVWHASEWGGKEDLDPAPTQKDGSRDQEEESDPDPPLAG